MRHLASIQRIHAVEPIEGADSIEMVRVLGWQVVVRKGEFKKYDLCIYCEIDSVLPEHEKFEFLRARKFKVKTVQLKGQISQGLVFPISLLKDFGIHKEVQLGEDVTELLGVTKREIPEVSLGMGNAAGNFPENLVPKTDETRIQSVPGLLSLLPNEVFYISEKADGTSATFLMTPDKDFLVCSRNLSIKDSDNLYWKAARQYDIQEILSSATTEEGSWRPLAIQGELVGPGIQKNRYGLKSQKLLVFNIWDILEAKYLDFEDFENFCTTFKLETVRILHRDFRFSPDNPENPGEVSLQTLLSMAQGLYPSGQHREGIVIRTMTEKFCPELKGRFSFKVINNDYLLKSE